MRQQASRYMMCTGSDLCSVPLDAKGQPAKYPTAHCGHLINESTLRPEGVYPSNVIVTTKREKRRNGHVYWRVIATRDIVPGEELLLCYGSDYGSREGYTVDPGCCK